MFIDKAKIHLIAGNGGNGSIHWRREKFVPSGGPDGGDGGRGGNIILEADTHVRTLADYKYKRKYKAESGQPGAGQKMFGRAGEDLVLKVPVGTVVREAESGLPIADLHEEGARMIVVQGGFGGKGNVHFKSSIRQAPRFAQPGGIGQELDVILEVKLLADVGLVGFPNVGKSTLLSVMTQARPKIANYPFTTLEPNLGVVKLEEGNSYVIADIPGLIEGASEGAGLGHDFLRHIERTRVLCHVIDMAGTEGRDPVEDYFQIQSELGKYSPELVKRVRVIVANKMDLPGAEKNLERFRAVLEKENIFSAASGEAWDEDGPHLLELSAATHTGVRELSYRLWDTIRNLPPRYETLDEAIVPIEQFFQKDRSIRVERNGKRIVATGEPLKTLSRKLILQDEDSVTFFERSLETMGVMDRIRALNPTEDDVIDVEGFEFDWL